MNPLNKLIAASCGALLMCASLRAGDKPASAPKPMPKSSAPASAPAAMPEMPKPGPEHAHLRKWAGTWDAAVKDYMMGKMIPGTGVWTCDGQLGFWVTCDYTGFSANGLFQGHEVMGYDTHAKMYTAYWVDTMGDFSMPMNGTMAGNVMTWTGKAPGMDGKMMEWKMTTTWMDDDHASFEMWMLGEKPMKVLEIAYSRRK